MKGYAVFLCFLIPGCVGVQPELEPSVMTTDGITITRGNTVGVTEACLRAGGTLYTRMYNGCYDIKNKTIYVSRNGSHSYFEILRHELCHAITGISVSECHVIYPAK